MITLRGVIAAMLCVVATTQAHAQGVRDESRGASSAGSNPSALPWLRLEDLDATRQRPVFAPDRRPLAPPPPPVAQVEAPPPPRKIPVLRGIIVERNATLILLEYKGTSDAVVIRSGETFGPWRVTLLSNRSVQLSNGDERINLDLFEE